MSFHGFHAGGHLTELALDRLAYDPPERDPELRAAARAHLATCAACAAALRVLAEQDARFDLRPRAEHLSRAITSPRAARPSARFWAAGLGAASLAAAVLVIAIRPWAPDDGADRFIAKGGSIELDVRVHDGTKSRSVDDGGIVYPGERAGFALRASEDGFVLVFGWDASGRPYAAYPGAEDLTRFAAVPIAKSPKLARVPAALRFDDVLGDEHLAAVYCPRAFTFTDMVPLGAGVDEQALRAAVAEEGAMARVGVAGCALRHIVLHKRAGPPGNPP